MSLQKWYKLLGILRIITPEVDGARGIFTHVRHALTNTTGRHMHLTAAVHNDLAAWCNLLASLLDQPTHLLELKPSPPTGSGLPMT